MVRTGKEIKAGRRECALKAVQFLVQQHMMPWTATQPIRAIKEVIISQISRAFSVADFHCAVLCSILAAEWSQPLWKSRPSKRFDLCLVQFEELTYPVQFPSLIPAMSYYPMNYTTQSYGMDQANEYKQPNDNSQAHNYDYEDDYVPSDDQADSGDQGSDGGAPVGLGRPGSSGDQQDGNESPYFRPYCGSLTMSDLGRHFPDYSFERYGYWEPTGVKFVGLWEDWAGIHRIGSAEINKFASKTSNTNGMILSTSLLSIHSSGFS
jgi:hypothetical protein